MTLFRRFGASGVLRRHLVLFYVAKLDKIQNLKKKITYTRMASTTVNTEFPFS